MNAELYRRAESVFASACRLAPPERAAFVRQACGADHALREAVLTLLAADPGDDDSTPAGTPGAPRLRDLAQAFAPDRIGDYRVLGVLGVGGSGVVLRARQLGLDRDVAIKLLHEEHVDGQAARRFAVEAHLLGSLDHPGIVRILESGVAPAGNGERPFFAMELVEGLSITRFAREHELGVRACLSLLVDVADAVHHAHQRGVVHRDLKPANILVTEDGCPRILDFGVARSLTGGEGVTTLDGGTDAVLGTFGYMSPEQMRGELTQVDMRSDVYSLGAIAHELLAQSVPVEPGASAPVRAPRPLGAPLEPLGELHRELRGDLEAVVGKAVAPEKTRRYASAAEFANDLRALLRGDRVSARRPSEFETLLRGIRQHKLTAAGVFAVVLALVVGLTVQSAAVTRNRREAERLQRLFEQVTQLLNDPRPNLDGRLVPAPQVTVRDRFAAAGPFVEELAERDPSAAGGIAVLAGRVLSAIGDGEEDLERSRLFIERGVELLTEGSGARHRQTLDARRDLIVAAAYDRRTDEALAMLRELERDAAGMLDDEPEMRLRLEAVRNRLAFQSGGTEVAELARIHAEAARELGPDHDFTLLTLLELAGRSPAEEGLALLEVEAERIASLGRPRLSWRAKMIEGRLRTNRYELPRHRDERDPTELAAARATLEHALRMAEELFGVDSKPAASARRRLELVIELEQLDDAPWDPRADDLADDDL